MAHALSKTGVTQNDTIDIKRASSGNDDNIWPDLSFTVTAFAKTFLDDADAATVLTTLGVTFDALAPTTTQGDIIYFDGVNNVRLAKGAAGDVLTMNGGATAPSWVAPGATYTDEQAEDAVGLILVDSSTIDFTYNDGGNTITAAVIDGSITLAKMANLAQDQFIIRTTASTGVPETATCTAAARTVLDDTTVGAMLDTLGGAARTGTGGVVCRDSPVITTEITVPNTGLHILDTNASHDLIIACGEDLTADRQLSIVLGNAARTLTLGGNPTLNGGTHSGTNTGDQTITLTGDVTGSGTGSFAATIGSNKVTLGMMAQVATATFLGRVTAATGNVEALTVVQANQSLAAVTGFAYAASKTLDLSTALNWQLTDTLTGDIALTLSNGADGYNGTVAFKQDGTGGRKITGITVSGRTVLMDGGLGASLNTTAFKAANAYSLLGFEYKTVNSTAIVFITLVTGAAAAYG